MVNTVSRFISAAQPLLTLMLYIMWLVFIISSVSSNIFIARQQQASQLKNCHRTD